jgi:AcrR family transcriptional regulator
VIGTEEKTTVALRREAKIAQIVACAWKLAGVQGVAAISLHALAREVGMRQPSLYEYFDSKHALYDAMFADGNRQLIDHLDALRVPKEPRAGLKRILHGFIDFALAEPARCELLFERHIPGFTPAPRSYALAEEALGRVVTVMRAAGITDQGDIDCLIAVTAGLMEAQLANDPGGQRWVRHLDRMIDLYLDDIQGRRST